MVMTGKDAPSWQTAYEQVTGSFDKASKIRYGESAVTELEHALQCAELADHAGADDYPRNWFPTLCRMWR
jgi:hypothetical protein